MGSKSEEGLRIMDESQQPFYWRTREFRQNRAEELRLHNYGFPFGSRVKINGTPLHDGNTGTVVDPEAELHKARAIAQKTGRKLSEGTT